MDISNLDRELAVEGNHVNDLGFMYIAKVLGDMIEKIL